MWLVRCALAAAGIASGVFLAAPAAAQSATPDPPGPYVFDIRGASSGIPSGVAFYPEIPADTSVAARGYGFDVGAHIYLLRLGPSRVGIGANFIQVRGTAPGVEGTVRLLAPQISFNFGTSQGWSYLSVGLGTARVRTEGAVTTTDPETDIETTSNEVRNSGSLQSINAGGGARWFLNARMALGFDVRMHRLGAGDAQGDVPGTTRTTLVSASVGLSIK